MEEAVYLMAGKKQNRAATGRGWGEIQEPHTQPHDPPSLTSATTFHSLFGKFRNVPFFLFIEAGSQPHNDRTHADQAETLQQQLRPSLLSR